MNDFIKYTYLCLLLAIASPLYAEDNKLYTDPRLQIIQPSQEAQSLGKFSEIPVDLYTGRTNINIPLLTISHNGIEVPVSLSYHGGGIKVDDECGLVGLGWTLNAGGVVNRIVRGMPDNLWGPFMSARGYNNLVIDDRNFIDSLMRRTRPDSPLVLLKDKSERHILKQMETYGQLYDENKIDVAPDNYIFQVQGMSGAFVTNTMGNLQYLQCSGGCTISHAAAGDKYVLTDVNGHKYTFAHHEKSNYVYRLENVFNPIPSDVNPEYVQQYISSWWLSSIVSSANDSITFEYITKKQLPPRQSIYGYTQYQIISEVLPDGAIVYANVPEEYNNYQDPYRRVGLDTIYQQLLSCIKTPHCILQFHYNESLYYPRLDSLSLHALGKPNDEDLIESFKLVYTDHTNRAKLSKMIHWGRNGQSQVYNFAYHTINAEIGHDNKDHWGYFSENSEGRFARKSYFGVTPQELKRSVYTERYADNINASNNMLKSITYPSGLSVEFTWEPHRISQLSAVGAEAYDKFKEYNYSTPTSSDCNVGGVRIKCVKYKDKNRPLLTKEYAYTDTNGISTGVLSYPPRYASLYPMIAYCTPNDYSSISFDTKLLVLRSNGLPYVLNGGGHIEYSKVTEYTRSDASNPDKINRIDYYYSTSAEGDKSDIDETQYDTLISADMLQLTSMRHRRGDLIKKVEYTDDYRVTNYQYQIIEKEIVEKLPGCLFPIADYQQYNMHFSFNGGSINPYKNLGIVKYRIIPYNKRLLEKYTDGDKLFTWDEYTYASNTYASPINADLPRTHSFLDSDGDMFVEHFEYWGATNKIKRYVATKNGYVIDAYRLKYDTKGHVTVKEIAPLDPTSPTIIDTIDRCSWDTIETYEYYPKINKLKEVHNYQNNVTTTYLWSYGGQYPIAEILNDSLETIENKICEDSLIAIQNSYAPDMSKIENLRKELPNAQINTMTYDPLVGITSYTDIRGYTTYYEYDDFGRICEIYEKVGEKKYILKTFDYHLRDHH